MSPFLASVLPSKPRFLALFTAFTLSSALFAQTRVVSDRVQGPIEESKVVTLFGNTHPLARAEFDRGVVAPETRLERMMLVLQPEAGQQRDMDSLAAAQQDPSSDQHHRWLSAEEYGRRFGVSAPDLLRVSNWLESRGFSVEPAPAGRTLIVFSGTAGQVADTFHTQIHRYEANGQAHIANVEDPQIPEALAPVVAGVLSLHDFRRVSTTRQTLAVPTPENTQGKSHYLFPADFATIYNLNPLYAAAQNGSGVSLAVVGRSQINLNDVSSFRSYAGLPANQPTILVNGANPGLVKGDQDEATLDVEWSGGVAPQARVKLVIAKSTATTDGVDLAAQYIVNNKTAPVMSTSFGNCEANMGATELAFYNSLWQQAALEGISSFVSSGDSGVSGCDAGSASKGTKDAVNGLCSSPYATCVGGTEFNEGTAANIYWSGTNGTGGSSALSYIPEQVWNESASTTGGQNLWASGGGVSAVYPQPAWQKGVAGANSNGMRAVPDVALNAAAHDGYLVCENGSWYNFSGTSAAAPGFAGIMAVLIQKQGGVGQGNVNPPLYGLLSTGAKAFHSTPNGNNSVPGATGFTASGTAYNLATGLGSVDANLLVSEWPATKSTQTQQGFTVKPSVISVSILPGKSGSFSTQVASNQGYAGNVSLSAGAPAGIAMAFSSATVKAGTQSTTTVTVASSVAPGTYNLTITGSGTVGTTPTSQTGSLTLNVLAPPTLNLRIGSASVSVAQGGTTSLLVETTTGGTFTGTMNFWVSGLPSGVTTSWSSPSLSASGASSSLVTLTIKAAASTSLNTTNIVFGVNGDGLSAQATTKVNITIASAIKLSASAAMVSMKAGGTQQLSFTLTPQGGVTAAANLSGVSFHVAGLPSGVTAAWGAPSLSQGIVTARLTLTGSKAAVVSSSKLTVTAALTDPASKVVYAATQPVSLSLTTN